MENREYGVGWIPRPGLGVRGLLGGPLVGTVTGVGRPMSLTMWHYWADYVERESLPSRDSYSLTAEHEALPSHQVLPIALRVVWRPLKECQT